jgi:hypothetical protein
MEMRFSIAQGANMKSLLIAATLCALGFAFPKVAQAQYPAAGVARPVGVALNQGLATRGDRWARQFADQQPWHGQYYYLQYGAPTALVVPPTAAMQQNYSWGVSQNTITPIYHQYGPTPNQAGGGAFYGTPIWPSHTRQFGVYPVRAPW